MSIRLRLTLTYSIILALTLIVFSTLLYFSQVRFTINSFQSRLAARTAFDNPPPQSPQGGGPRRPRIPGPAVYTQVRDISGEVIERDANLGNLELPLSAQGLQAIQSGQTWVEPTRLADERFLVQSRLVTDATGEQKIVQVAGSLLDRDRYLESLRTILLIGSALAIVAAFGIGWLLAGLALRPINRIRQTAQAIGQESDFSRRVDYHGPNDEIGQLATTFNSMLAALQTAFLQSEEALQTQKRFVADASHELRTPLTTLQGNIELLKRQPPISPADQADVLNDMKDESGRLIRLVNNLLTLARADVKRTLRQQSIPLQPLLEDVCQQIQRLAPTKPIDCDASTPLKVMGDPDALRQVLLVLLDNALKHTPPEVKITVRMEREDHQAKIIIQDNGPGIPPDILPHIFDRFYQGDAARTGTGTGLGLAIAQELVEAQQGTIAVQSQIEQGVTFTLTFPTA